MPPAFVTRATKSTIDFFVGPLFQEAKGSSVPVPSHCDIGILSSHSKHPGGGNDWMLMLAFEKSLRCLNSMNRRFTSLKDSGALASLAIGIAMTLGAAEYACAQGGTGHRD